MSQLSRFIAQSPRPLGLPIAVAPGLALTGACVRELVSDAQAQFEAARALHQRFETSLVMSAMDLSCEAEAFGAEVRLEEHEVPRVQRPLVRSLAEVESLAVPPPGAQRTAVYLETVQRLALLPERPLVLGGMMGPFSLAASLLGVSEALMLTAVDPELLVALLEKTTRFLSRYAAAFKEAGASGVFMAEPTAGLLSPSSLEAFSSCWVKHILESVEDDGFSVIYHNCGARLVHLQAILSAGVKHLHVGAPMDLGALLPAVDRQLLVLGNLDPSRVFLTASAEEVRQQTLSLLEATKAYANFVPSSGCDLPPQVPLENLAAFYQAIDEFSRS
jgi:uroporphyrinogen decarboxylase